MSARCRNLNRGDGIAVIAMGRLGVDAERLVSALIRLRKYSLRDGRKAVNEWRYVPMDQRVRFIRTVAARIASLFESSPAAVTESSKPGTSRDTRQCCP